VRSARVRSSWRRRASWRRCVSVSGIWYLLCWTAMHICGRDTAHQPWRTHAPSLASSC